MGVRGYFIQYKFITPDKVKHSSYSYQKLFRALYGYTQAVDKASGKRYRYHRKGVLSEVPHIRPRKNCVIIPPEYFQPLIEFFKTGRNPTHAWKGKGDWKAVYYMNEKDLTETDVVKAIEAFVEKRFLFQGQNEPSSFIEVLKRISGGTSSQDKAYLPHIVQKTKSIVDLDWFKNVYQKSEKLSELYSCYKKMKVVSGV